MKNQKGNIFIIVAFLTVILVLAAALVFGVFRRGEEETNIGSNIDPQVQKLETQNSSDEVASIEKDLNDTDVDSLDIEVSAAEQTIERL